MTQPRKATKATETTRSKDTAEVDRRDSTSGNVRDDMELVVLDEDTEAGLRNAINNTSAERGVDDTGR